MCGICGIVGVEQPREAEFVVRRMMAALEHRGPDDEGFCFSPPVALGMRRLSIIDLPGGRQPVWNEDQTHAVVFNGEIYNFRELRAALEAEGHRFRTRSDSEVVVHAYEAWGKDCVLHLRGMFAFAALEMPGGPSAGAERIFLARDRLGIKPLYYAAVDGAFLFASEVRALLASGRLAAELSPPAVAGYLLFGSVGEPMTLVRGISSLPPGHRMFVSVKSPCFQPETYWEPFLAERRPERTASNSAEPEPKRVRALLSEALEGHLIADVPLGIFLSSGIDSTALTALASRKHGGIHTFTVVFPEQDYSEAELARHTAQRLGTDHRELRLSGEDMQARLDEAVAAFDQPSMDGINSYFVSWAARQAGLKVALSGLGGDELFGGYSTFRSAPRIESLSGLARWVPAPLRSLTAEGVRKTSRRRPDAAGKLAAAWDFPDALPHPYFFTRALFTPQGARTLLQDSEPGWAATPWWAWLSEAARQASAFDSFARVSWLEMRSYMVNTLLRDTDAMSMSHSLEVRLPFLDHPLVEYVLALPASGKRRRGIPKALLVEALEDLLPREILAQRKRTFTFPWQNWLRGPLRERVASGLADWTPVLGEILDRERVAAVWQDFLKGRTSWSRPWSLYVLNEWARKHLQGSGSSAAAEHRAAAPAT
jgi:asparagine synthase (glutamine-hydrolysing)